MKTTKTTITTVAVGLAMTASSQAVTTLRVTIENLSAANGITFAPLRVGFGNGSFDSFDEGSAPGAPIISVAEGGSGSAWFPAFGAAEPNAITGTVANGGPLLPGASTFVDFTVNNLSADNRFFTFASMVVPSNDLFIGNDDPMEYQLFDATGNLLINTITLNGAEIWDANSELAIAANAAFLVGGTNALREEEGGNVAFDFSELSVYDGMETAAGYNFDASTVTAGGDIYRISFEAIPEPSTSLLAGLGVLAGLSRRRRA